jgi:hypothetical protein
MSAAVSSPTVSTTPRRSRPRRWLWAGAWLATFALLVWGGLHLGQALWHEGHAMGLGLGLGLGAQAFDITVNGQPWGAEGLGDLIGWAVGAALLCGLLLLMLAVFLPMALGAVLMGLLLVVGLVLGLVALPVLLVLVLLMSPLLLLGGFAWLLLA